MSDGLAGLDLGFVLCVERGPLEAQALLLCRSVRELAGGLASAPIYALSPRAGRQPGRETLAALASLDVAYDDRTLNLECAEYGSANRVAAAAHVERTTRHELLAVLDTDTVFLAPPLAFALPAATVAAVRPVDVKGMCTAGPPDPCDRYWRALCDSCGVPYDVLPWLTTSIDERRVKACYNGGLVLVRREHGVLGRWWDFFLRAARRGLRPWDEAPQVRSSTGWVAPDAARWWGSNQAALSLALWSTTRAVELLPAGYNYPLHQHRDAPARLREAALADLVHVHYHHLFAADVPPPNPLLDPALPLPAATREWLGARLPLAVRLAGPVVDAGEPGRGAARPLPAAAAGNGPNGVGAPGSGRDRGARPAAAGASRQLVIAGMHRSGTSLVASVLRAAGVDLGRDVRPGVGNPRGHFEDADFHRLHEDALAALGATWLDVRPLLGAHEEPWQGPFRQRAAELIAARSHLSLWGWKDPRTTLFLQAWHELLPAPAYLLLYRHPVEVTLSLWRRGNDPLVRSTPWLPLQAWLLYNQRLLAFCERHRERCLLAHVPTAVADLPAFVRRIGERLALPLRGDVQETLLAADELSSAGAPLPGWERVIPGCVDLYGRLEALADLPSPGVVARAGTNGDVPSAGLAARERDLWRAAEELLQDLLDTRGLLAEIEGSRSFGLVQSWWRLRRRWSRR